MRWAFRKLEPQLAQRPGETTQATSIQELGQDSEVSTTSMPKQLSIPSGPTAQERQAHELIHLHHRPWYPEYKGDIAEMGEQVWYRIAGRTDTSDVQRW